MVTEDYLADCISYQLVLNPNQAKYHVEGYQPAATAATPDRYPNDVPPATEPISSRRVTQDLCLQSQMEAHMDTNLAITSHNLKVVKKSPLDNSDAVDLPTSNKSTLDALDVAMQETLAVKDLVNLMY